MSKYKGFTLIEMMVVLAIFSMVMGIAYTTLRLNDTYRDLVLIKIQLYRQNKKALDSLSAELQRSSTGITNWTIVDGGGPTNPDTIRFEVPWVDAAYAVEWGAENNAGYSIRYSVDGNNNLVREVLDTLGGVDASQIIAENIINLQFTPISPNYIQINLTSQRQTIQRRPISANLESNVYLRNQP